MLALLAFGLPAAIIALAVYLMRHRDNRLARGIASASATYNELYGQGRPPELPLPPELADEE